MYAEIPQPDQISTRDKEDAMGGYFMMFASLAAGLPLPIINLVAAIIYYALNKKNSRFVHFHSLQSLLSQLPTSLLNAAAVIWASQIWIFENIEYSDVFKGYLIGTLIANLLYIIFSIVAAIQARKGRFFYFLFFGKLSFHYAFKLKAENQENSPVNKAPL